MHATSGLRNKYASVFCFLPTKEISSYGAARMERSEGAPGKGPACGKESQGATDSAARAASYEEIEHPRWWALGFGAMARENIPSVGVSWWTHFDCISDAGIRYRNISLSIG